MDDGLSEALDDLREGMFDLADLIGLDELRRGDPLPDPLPTDRVPANLNLGDFMGVVVSLVINSTAAIRLLAKRVEALEAGESVGDLADADRDRHDEGP